MTTDGMPEEEVDENVYCSYGPVNVFLMINLILFSQCLLYKAWAIRVNNTSLHFAALSS